MASFRERGPHQVQARVRRIGYPDLVKTFQTPQEAQQWAAAMESEVALSVIPSVSEAAAMTLGEALTRYSRLVTPTKKGAANEQRRIRVWQQNPLSRRLLSSIRSADLAQFRDARLADGKSGNTVRLDLALISHLFETARREWNMESLGNPVKAIRKPKVSRGRDRRMSADEERLLKDYCAAHHKERLVAMICLAVETAMRRSELIALKWSDIVLAVRVARLHETKNGSARDVPLSPAAIALLERYPKTSDGRVFDVNKDWVTGEFRAACKALGIVGLRFHDLRHEATSRLFEKGLNMMEVATITGHKSLAMLQRYTHLKASDIAAKLQAYANAYEAGHSRYVA